MGKPSIRADSGFVVKMGSCFLFDGNYQAFLGWFRSEGLGPSPARGKKRGRF